MLVATSADLITPLAKGSTLPDGPLVTIDGEKTTLHAIVQNNPAIILFYRGSW